MQFRKDLQKKFHDTDKMIEKAQKSLPAYSKRAGRKVGSGGQHQKRIELAGRVYHHGVLLIR